MEAARPCRREGVGQLGRTLRDVADGVDRRTGCGFDVISHERESLFTNVTLCPTLIVTLEGVAVLFAIVIVAPLGPGPPLGGEGLVGEPPLLPPHAIASASTRAAAVCPASRPVSVI